MTSVFTHILEGTSPGRFIWRDETCFAILTIEPRRPGHTLVIPLAEVDRWTDLSEPDAMHIFRVGRIIGLAQQAEWDSPRVGLMYEGYMVPHSHLHVWPSWTVFEYSHTGIDRNAKPAELDAAAIRLRARLEAEGHGEFVPPL
jgi:histidine triad (HIT) family protein